MRRNHKKGEYTVTYRSRDHLSVIFQLYGSVWPEVIPYCLFNVGLVLLDFFVVDPVLSKYGFKVTDKGHTISIFFVSFLVVSRANMALARYNSARNHLGNMFFKTRALTAGIVSNLTC
jgi:predicted membrane chloride channel (bestrophin family)